MLGASVLGFIWPHFSLALRAACLQGNAMPPLYVFWVSLILIWVQAVGPWDAQQRGPVWSVRRVESFASKTPLLRQEETLAGTCLGEPLICQVQVKLFFSD